MWVPIIVALIALASAVIVALINGWFGTQKNDATPPPTPQVTASSPAPSTTSSRPDYQEALDGLTSKEPRSGTDSITRLAFVITDEGEPQRQRYIVLRSLATFVRSHAPKTPNPSYDYCLKAPPPLYVPPEVEMAIQPIGSKLPADDGLEINLTGINAAYASLPNLNLRNVRLDGALLCRAILVKAQLEGASFRDTNLRFSWMQDSQGVTADQLKEASSLQNVELPASIVNSPVLKPLLAIGPSLPRP